MKKVFFSYAHEDSQFAQKLLAGLDAADLPVWLDKADMSPGDPWKDKIRNELQQASAMIVLVSPRSVDNQMVQFEVGAASTLGKRIIPVVIADTNIERGLPDWLRDYAFIDARQRSIQEVALEVVRAVAVE